MQHNRHDTHCCSLAKPEVSHVQAGKQRAVYHNGRDQVVQTFLLVVAISFTQG
jgi:hypothetical protein